ncbi:hypothetical protein FQR65_LT06856 [Abscondita terminalis]|nr:hypothetical protein FQR65_LT06856 [Abscondita terminalis]
MIDLRPESPEKVISTNWWRSKSQFEKTLLVVVLLIAGVILSFLTETTVFSHKQYLRPCNSEKCIVATADILNQIDEAVDPCNNFYKFTCGKLASITHSKDVTTESMKYQLEKQLINILTEPIHVNDHPSLKFEKEVYGGCVTEASDGTTSNAVKTIFTDLGGWPVLMGDKWNGNKFELIELITKLKNLGLFQETILKVRVGEEALTVKGPSLFSRNDRNLEFYRKLMIDQAISVGANESIAKEDMSRAFDFMLAINNLNDLDANTTRDKMQRVSIYELQQQYKGIDWLKCLKVILDSSENITKDEYIVFPYSYFPQHFINLMTANNRTVANYVLWTAFASISNLISNELLNLHNQVRCLKGFPIKTRTIECLDVISQVCAMYPNPSYLAFVDRSMSPETIKQVQDMFDLILNEFRKLIAMTTWIDKDSKSKAYKWLKELKLIVGFNAKIDEIYRKIYKPYNKSDSFLSTYLKLKREFPFAESYNKKTQNLPNNQYFKILNTQIIYLKEEQIIGVPVSMMQGFYFDGYRPMYLNYAALGKSIASVIVYTYSKLAYKLNSKLWSEETKKKFPNKTSCVSHNYEYFGDEGNLFMTYKYYEKQFKIAQIVGIKLAYNAYKTWTFRNGKELHLIGLNYTSDQLFWIYSFRDVCFEEADNGNNFHSDNEVVRQNDNFAHDFNCVLNSKMNPSNKCSLL